MRHERRLRGFDGGAPRGPGLSGCARLGRAAGLAVAGVFLVGALGGLVGCMVVPTTVQLGPHRAQLRLTPHPTTTVDLGPIGSIRKPGGVLGMGIVVTVKEIPTGSQSPNPAITLEQYARLYSDVQATRSAATVAMLRHGLWCALTADAVALALFVGLRRLLGADRRRELAAVLRKRRRRAVAAASAVAVAVTTLYGANVALSGAAPSSASRLFDGTALEGASVDGAVLQLLVDQYGPRVSEFIDQTNAFYDTLTHNVDVAAEDSPVMRATDSTRTVLFIAGFHCNIGMARTIERVADVWNPSFVLSAGDDGLGASGFEAPCIGSLGSHLRGHRVVVAPGDHDSDAAIAEMRRNGFTVLDSQPVKQSGLRILGDDDPRLASLAAGLVSRRDETVTEMGDRLADLACADATGIDVVVANEPGAVIESARRGCATLVLAGSDTDGVRAIPTVPGGRTVPGYFVGSSGGAAQSTITVGALQARAHEVVLEFEAKTGRPRRFQHLEFSPDGSALIGPPTALATPTAIARS